MTAFALRVVGVAAVVVALIACGNLFIRHERAIGYEQCRSEVAEQENADLKAAREDTARLFALYDKAQHAIRQCADRQYEEDIDHPTRAEPRKALTHATASRHHRQHEQIR